MWPFTKKKSKPEPAPVVIPQRVRPAPASYVSSSSSTRRDNGGYDSADIASTILVNDGIRDRILIGRLSGTSGGGDSGGSCD